MFVLYADRIKLTVHQRETVTSGSMNAYRTRFEFSPEWEGMGKTACFKSGRKTVCVLLDETGVCTVPWEVTDLEDSGKHLFAGVFGTRGEAVVLPTVWADCGVILEGATTEKIARPPTAGLYEQILNALDKKVDRVGLDGPELKFLSGDKVLASVTLPSAGSSAAGETATDTEMNELLDEVFGAGT